MAAAKRVVTGRTKRAAPVKDKPKCPECETELDLVESQPEIGDIVDCDECGNTLTITNVDPFTLVVDDGDADSGDDDEDEDDDDDSDDDDEDEDEEFDDDDDYEEDDDDEN